MRRPLLSLVSIAIGPGTVLRAAVALTVVLACVVPAAAQCANVPGTGAWQGPWDFECLIPDPANDHPQGAEFSHAALITQGHYRGKVLLWRARRETSNPGFTTATYVFDPDWPERLVQIDQVLFSDIFCAGQSWNESGVLVVTGGLHSTLTSNRPHETYRFLPVGLPPPPQSEDPLTCGPSSVFLAQIQSSPWVYVDQMSIGRYYPTLIHLTEGEILTNQGSNLPDACAFVIGGHGVGNAQDPPDEKISNELWQLLPPAGSSWSHTLYSDAPVHPLGPPTPNEQYLRKTLSGTLPEVQLNNYPRILQLTDIQSPQAPGNKWLRNLFVASDVWPDSALPPTTTAGSSWVIRPRYAVIPPTWEIWTGPTSSTSSNPPNNDRHYGDAVLLQTLESNFPTSDGRNRVLVLGGMEDLGTGLQLTPDVQEFKPGTNPADAGAGAAWVKKTDNAAGPPYVVTPRVYLNCVVLPDRRVLVVGGSSLDAGGGEVPFEGTELFDPGAAGAQLDGTVQILADRPPSSPSGLHAYARGYHSFALLLPDGRVVVGGGATYDSPGWDNSQFSVEMFCPPYMGYPDKPQITSLSHSTITFDQGFDVNVREVAGKPIVRVVLLRPAARTHHFDSDQRYVELAIDTQNVQSSGGIETYPVFAPPEDHAPPGYYLLFAVRDIDTGPGLQLNPSIGMWVLLQGP